mmetsp:Transcript_25404/g.65651  ORF Transcript_25404/g.65651 Transcript_25404/m.65651 type:complete len:1003 (+) Transcript_25404:76-3084(+)
MRAHLLVCAVAVGFVSAFDISQVDTSKLPDPSKVDADTLKAQVGDIASSLKGDLLSKAKSWLAQLVNAEKSPTPATAVDAVLSAARADLRAFSLGNLTSDAAAQTLKNAAASAKAKADEMSGTLDLTPEQKGALNDVTKKIEGLSGNTLDKAKSLMDELKQAQAAAADGDEKTANEDVKEAIDEAKKGVDAVPDDAGASLAVPKKIEVKLEEVTKIVDSLPPDALAKLKDMVEAMQQASTQHVAGDDTGARLAIGKALTDAKSALDSMAAKKDAAPPALTTSLVDLGGLIGSITDKLDKGQDPTAMADKLKQIASRGDSVNGDTLGHAKNMVAQLQSAAESVKKGEMPSDELAKALESAKAALDSMKSDSADSAADTPAADAEAGAPPALDARTATVVSAVISFRVSKSSAAVKSLSAELGSLSPADLDKAKSWLGELKASADAKQEALTAPTPALKEQAQEVSEQAVEKAEEDATAQIESVKEAKAEAGIPAAAAATIAALDLGPFKAKAQALEAKLDAAASDDAKQKAAGFLDDLKAAAEAKMEKVSAKSAATKEAAEQALEAAKERFEEKKEAAMESLEASKEAAAQAADSAAEAADGAAEAAEPPTFTEADFFDLDALAAKAKALATKAGVSDDTQAKAEGWLNDLKKAAIKKAKALEAKADAMEAKSAAKEAAAQKKEAALEAAEQSAEAAVEAAEQKAEDALEAAEQKVEQAKDATADADVPAAADADAAADSSSSPSVDDAVVLVDQLSAAVKSLRDQLDAVRASVAPASASTGAAVSSFASLWTDADKAAMKKWLDEQHTTADPASLLKKAKEFKQMVVDQKKRDMARAKDELTRRVARAKDEAERMLAAGKNATDVYDTLKDSIKSAKQWAKDAFDNLGDAIYNLTNATGVSSDSDSMDAEAASEATETLALLSARAATAENHASHFTAAAALLFAGVAVPAAGIAIARRRRVQADAYDSYVAASEGALARGIGSTANGDGSLTVAIMRDDRL